MSELTKDGREFFDQTPVAYPFKFDRPTPLHMRIRSQILSLLSDMRANDEIDTPEEADDFEMDDLSEPWENSPYEVDFDHIADKKFSEVSKEESAPQGGSSGGTSQEETESKGEA